MILMERAQTVRAKLLQIGPRGRWRVQRLYGFSRSRAVERLIRAAPDPESPSKERNDLRVLESMYGMARQQDDIVTDCAVNYFRARAMADADHPDFHGEWI